MRRRLALSSLVAVNEKHDTMTLSSYMGTVIGLEDTQRRSWARLVATPLKFLLMST